MSNLVRNIGAGVTLVTLSDYQLGINTVDGSTQIYLPNLQNWIDFKQKSGFSGDLQSLRVSDIGNFAATNNISVFASAGNNINGLASVIINLNGASGLFVPNADGTSWTYLSSIPSSGGGSTGATGATGSIGSTGATGAGGADGSNNLTWEHEAGISPSGAGFFVNYSTITDFFINISTTAKFSIDASAWLSSISVGDFISLTNKTDSSNIIIVQVVAINSSPSSYEFQYSFISGAGGFLDVDYAIGFVKNGVGGGTYTGNSPSTVTVNGIPSGTVLTGLTLEYLLQNIYAPYLAPAFTSFIINVQSQLIQVGTVLSGIKNFLWGTSNSGNVQPNSIDIRDVNAGTLIATGLANDGTENVNIGSIVNNSPISQSWRGEGVNTQLAAFISSNFTVNSIYPVIYGKVASGGAPSGGNRPVANQALINSGTVAVVSSTGTITVSFNTTSDDYMWFAIPSTSTSKTQWYVDSLNNGSIGGAVSPAGNLFPAFDSVVVDSPTALWTGVSYKIYIANYQSGIVVPMELRN